MAEERLPCWRVESMSATRSDKVLSLPVAISFRSSQNASSKETLVLCPAMTIERLTTWLFMMVPSVVGLVAEAMPIELPIGPSLFGSGLISLHARPPVHRTVGFGLPITLDFRLRLPSPSQIDVVAHPTR